MRATRRANIEDLRFHDLRHEATTRFFEKGLNIMEVASITGHKDLRMLRRYTHLKAEDLAQKLG
jgi:integrase